MRVLRLLTTFAALLGLSIDAAAQPFSTTGAVAPQQCTVSEVISDLCGPKLLGIRIAVMDGADSTECGNLGDAGLGTSENLCRWSDAATAWVTDDVAGISGGGTHPIAAGDYGVGSIAIADIAPASKTGADGELVTGTATIGECGQFDANGDLIGAGAACGAGEANTHSSEAGGLGLTATAPKVGVDLRLIALDAADFDRTGDVASIDATKWAELTDLHSDESAASETVAGILETATVAEVDIGTDTGRAVSPGSLAGAALTGDLGGTFGAATVDASHSGTAHHADESAASETVAGILETATIAEVDIGTDTGRAVSPDSLDGAAMTGDLGGTFGAASVNATHAGTPHHTVFGPNASPSSDHSSFDSEVDARISAAGHEEEAEIGTTTVTGNAADDQYLNATGVNAATWKALPAGGTDGCSAAGDKPIYTASTNTWGCGTDGGGGGGDNVEIDGVAAADPDFRSDGDLDAIRCTAPATPDASCVAAEDVIYRYNAGSIVDADIDAAAAIAGTKIVDATETVEGVLEVATQVEANFGTIDTKIMTPKKVADFVPGGQLGGQLDSATLIPAADHIDDILEIAAARKTGTDTQLVTGTKGATDDCAKWDVNGDLVTSGTACAAALTLDECTIVIELPEADELVFCGKPPAAITVASLNCTATGTAVPSNLIVEMVECAASGGTCVSSGYDVELDARLTNYEDTVGSDSTIGADKWWGLTIVSVTTTADVLQCQLEFNR